MSFQHWFMILFPVLLAVSIAIAHLIDLWRGGDE